MVKDEMYANITDMLNSAQHIAELNNRAIVAANNLKETLYSMFSNNGYSSTKASDSMKEKMNQFEPLATARKDQIESYITVMEDIAENYRCIDEQIAKKLDEFI